MIHKTIQKFIAECNAEKGLSELTFSPAFPSGKYELPLMTPSVSVSVQKLTLSPASIGSQTENENSREMSVQLVFHLHTPYRFGGMYNEEWACKLMEYLAFTKGKHTENVLFESMSVDKTINCFVRKIRADLRFDASEVDA